MKKLLLIALCLISVQMTTKAADDKPITASELPANSQKFLHDHFTGTTVSQAITDKDMTGTTYEVELTNGARVEFDKDGEWKQIKCKNSEVPKNIVPEKITSYVSEHYNGHKITEIERYPHEYEVRLDNGRDLKFDLAFNPKGMMMRR